MTDRQKIANLILQGKEFNLFSHMLPDGDSVGSLLAMGEALTRMNKHVRMYTPGHIPGKYAFLSGADAVSHAVIEGNPDIISVILDCSDPPRLGIYEKAAMMSSHIVNIDHHVTNQRFGTLNLVDARSSATGEIVYGLIKDMHVSLTKTMAESLYVAISTDTGSFKYENTTGETHRVVSELMEFDLSPGAISQRIFDERPLSFYILLKEALSSLELYEHKQIALMTLSNDIRKRIGATTDDLEGIVNYSRNIEGAELGILFYVESPREVKVGFRSKTMDVSALAGRLNGGGHIRAAGCRMQGSFEEVKKLVMEEACKSLQALQAKSI